MNITVREALVENGQLVLQEPIQLPDGTRVKVRVEQPGESALLDIARSAVDMGAQDSAEQHDHYIYGSPKRAG